MTEKIKNSLEEEFWTRAANFNLNPRNLQIPSEFKSEDIDELLSKVMQAKMKLVCKVSGKSICITLS